MMLKRKKIVAGNWKMNMNYKEANLLFDSLLTSGDFPDDVQILLAPPTLYLSEFAMRATAEPSVKLAAQNVHYMENGAFTGEISVTMLASISVEYCIIGHSERRTIFRESNEDIGKKAAALIQHGITPVICVGEMLDDRYENRQNDVVLNQLSASLSQIANEDVGKVIVAYEPVWAIGTGQTATSAQAQEMHSYIRESLQKKYSSQVAEVIPILYGGSCNAGNAAELFSQPDIDGGLIGGASLKESEFIKIIHSFH